MPFPAVCVANEFLRIAQEKGEALTPMKVQKLVYFAHGWYLAITGDELLADRIEAWQYGPVIPSLYREFRAYGNDPVTAPASSMKVGLNGKVSIDAPCLDDYSDAEKAEKAKEIIARVFDVYGPYSAVRLSNATHANGSPWQQVYRDGVRHTVIPNSIIKSYFESLANVGK